MASVHEYKRFENNLVEKTKNGVVACFKAIGAFFKAIGNALTRRYTVVLVPHSEKKVYNFHISVLSICCFFLILSSILGTLFWYGASYRSTHGNLLYKDSRLSDAQASLDQIRDEVNHLLADLRNFEPALSSTLSVIGADIRGTGRTQMASTGDLSSFFNVRESPAGTLREVEDLRRLSAFLTSAANPIREIGDLLMSQGALLTEIPSIWPIRGGIGVITMPFGQNYNPFTGQRYIHRGIDIATPRGVGDPIVATADGQVVSVEFDVNGFGNNVIIRHRHGFFTRYAHMQRFNVQIGQRVQQGQIIGTIGNTGLSTGPHLHYEVHIGSDVVDPLRYINMRSNLVRTAR